MGPTSIPETGYIELIATQWVKISPRIRILTNILAHCMAGWSNSITYSGWLGREKKYWSVGLPRGQYQCYRPGRWSWLRHNEWKIFRIFQFLRIFSNIACQVAHTPLHWAANKKKDSRDGKYLRSVKSLVDLKADIDAKNMVCAYLSFTQQDPPVINTRVACVVHYTCLLMPSHICVYGVWSVLDMQRVHSCCVFNHAEITVIILSLLFYALSSGVLYWVWCDPSTGTNPYLSCLVGVERTNSVWFGPH